MASSFQTRPRRNRRRVRSSPQGPALGMSRGKLIPIDVKAGDRVLFGKWSGTEVKIEGQDYLIMKESDLLGVVDKTGLKKAA